MLLLAVAACRESADDPAQAGSRTGGGGAGDGAAPAEDDLVGYAAVGSTEPVPRLQQAWTEAPANGR
jgi:hypothetical protein